MKIEIYSKNGCSYCSKAKDYFKNTLKQPYTEYTLGVNTTKAEIESRLGREIRTVPQIWINDEHIGGFSELIKKFS